MSINIIQHGAKAFEYTCVRIYEKKCPFCKCRFQFEESDRKIVNLKISLKLKKSIPVYVIRCPECAFTIELEED